MIIDTRRVSAIAFKADGLGHITHAQDGFIDQFVRSMPSISAPRSMTERSTPAAKRLSFHFFFTDLAVKSKTLLLGRTSAEVATSPVSSSMV